GPCRDVRIAVLADEIVDGRARAHALGDRVRPGTRALCVRVRQGRAEQDVAQLHLRAARTLDLDEVVSVLCADRNADLARPHGERGIGELAYPVAPARPAQVAAVLGRR